MYMYLYMHAFRTQIQYIQCTCTMYMHVHCTCTMYMHIVHVQCACTMYVCCTNQRKTDNRTDNLLHTHDEWVWSHDEWVWTYGIARNEFLLWHQIIFCFGFLGRWRFHVGGGVYPSHGGRDHHTGGTGRGQPRHEPSMGGGEKGAWRHHL